MRNLEPTNFGILTTTSWLRQQQASGLLVFVVFVPLGCGFRCFCFSFRCFRCRSQLVGSAGWLVSLASWLAGQPASQPPSRPDCCRQNPKIGRLQIPHGILIKSLCTLSILKLRGQKQRLLQTTSKPKVFATLPNSSFLVSELQN